ncbi:hypothetical protein D0869_02309 [Hortaea werneckii]|uniref:Uncharacterized protein n=3 Tax=Hortaea werneckii TaxID=91943 RepID=A0A3M6X9Q1_HORWE|nr:hypothetical protein D0869_02309 [Hortaea werneckii]RMY25470.1 hypothetical protein D0867_00712 [Hortaea werneckii]RMY41267.1 hypothetical protein D0866_00719 [Hortaea werneckii]
MLCRTAVHTLRSSTSISRTIYIRPTVTSALFHKQSKPTQTRTMATEIKTFNTPKSAQPVGPYSQAVIAGPHVFVSGQIPATAEGKLVEGSIADKTTACCEGLKNILEDAGSSISRCVKVTVFLTTMENFAEMNSVYEKYFTHKPSRSCVAVKELPKGVPVEIEAMALTGSG